MRLRLAIFSALGVALALYLVGYVGWRAVFSAAIGIGLGGFAIFCLCGLGVFLVLGAAWHVLLPDSQAISPWVFIRSRMVRDSAAEVLPVSQFGGIASGVRAAILQGVSAPPACASMIVDVTTEMLAQIAYLALGIAILTARVPRTPVVASLTSTSMLGLAFAVVAAGLFVAVQRYGRRITARLAGPLLRSAHQAATGVSMALDEIYRSPLRVTLSVALHFAGWIGSGLGVWLGFRLMGAHVDVAAVLAIESLVYATRSAAVVVPNALGVQEAAYALLAPLFGVGAELALAMSVLKRARDIALGIPVLLLWNAAEGRRAVAGARLPAGGGS
jgi:glycosyltransferase 2 family protein